MGMGLASASYQQEQEIKAKKDAEDLAKQKEEEDIAAKRVTWVGGAASSPVISGPATTPALTKLNIAPSNPVQNAAAPATPGGQPPTPTFDTNTMSYRNFGAQGATA
jgi:hypothetical protein